VSKYKAFQQLLHQFVEYDRVAVRLYTPQAERRSALLGFIPGANSQITSKENSNI